MKMSEIESIELPPYAVSRLAHGLYTLQSLLLLLGRERGFVSRRL